MNRNAASVIVGFVFALGTMGSAPLHSMAQSATPVPAATPNADGLCVGEAGTDWMTAAVQPPGPRDAVVLPSSTVAIDGGVRLLYLVEITLPPGDCMPYSALGNQKDGAIVMIVQQGVIQFQWEALDSGSVGEAQDERGDAEGPVAAVIGGERGPAVPEGTPQTLETGDWVTMDQQVQFSYSNPGTGDAVILKAVWAVDRPGGCGGGCK
jgi:hypothetical protein